MVRIDKIFSYSLLLSILAASSLSAVGTPLEVIPIDEIDMTEATLAFFPERVHTDGMEERAALFYDKEGFFVRTSDDDVRVQRYDTDKLLRGRKVEDIARYSTMGKFKLSKLDNGEYVVRSYGELKGGGPIAAAIGYWGTKVVCYGVATAAAITGGAAAIAATGGAATPAVAAAVGGATAAAGVTAAPAVAIGAAAVGSGIAATGAAAAATTTTAAVVTSAGGIGGAVAAVETASTAVGGFLLLLPIP